MISWAYSVEGGLPLGGGAAVAVGLGEVRFHACICGALLDNASCVDYCVPKVVKSDMKGYLLLLPLFLLPT